MTHLPVSGHELHTYKVVAGETKPPRQPTKSTPKRQASHSGIGDLSDRGRQPVLLSCSIEVRPPGSTLHASGSIIRTHDYRAHGRQIDHESAIARRVPRKAVSAAADCKQQLAFARKSHGAHDVRSVGAASDQSRVLVDHSVPDPACWLIAFVPRGQQRSAEARAKFPNGGALYGCLGSRELYSEQICRS